MDVEIGINIVAKLYLHILDNEMPTSFEVKNIISVEESELGTVIGYRESANPYHSDVNRVDYIVSETVEDINKAIRDAEFYRDEGLRHIQSLLEG